MKKLIFLLVAMLVGFGSITTAEARPKDKQYHYSKVQKKSKPVKVVQKQNNVIRQPVYDEDTVAGYWNAEYNRKKPPLEGPVEKAARKFVASSQDLTEKASRHMGASANQLGLPRSLWCADFMNMLVGGTDRRAISYAKRGTKAYHGCVNCIAVTTREGGAHVGVVSGYDEKGNPIIVSGNHNRKVGVATYDKRRVIAYRYI